MFPLSVMKMFRTVPLLISGLFLAACAQGSVPMAVTPNLCGVDIPPSWHIRSTTDQMAWNREGNVTPPAQLTAEDVFQSLQSGDVVPFKPAIFSLADSETALPGHSEDPGAEDANRQEIDVLQMSGAEVQSLRERILSLPSPLNNYAVSSKRMGDREVMVIRHVADAKYYGMELILVPESSSGKHDGWVFYNRSNDAETPDGRTAFRQEAEHFFATLQPSACPSEWGQQS